MISFDLFEYDDLKLLFEGFQVSFLQNPIRRPKTTLKEYIPKGFRSNKLQKNQLVKIYCDAVSDGEKSLTEFVTKEIESVFDSTGLKAYFEDNDADPFAKMSDVTTIILNSGLDVPAYVFLLLAGIPCADDLKSSSVNLFQASVKACKIQFDKGFEKGKSSSEEELKKKKKRADKLEKSEKEYKDKNKELNRIKKELENDNADLNNDKELLKSTLLQLEEKVDGFDIVINKVKNDLINTKNELKRAQTDLETEREKNQQLSDSLTYEKEEKERALELAFSDDVVKRLVSEIMDEVKATSLGKKEIIDIAKKRFSDSTTISEGWEQLASENEGLIDVIVTSFGEGCYDEHHLDDLELTEDNLLIQYSVIKSLKAVLYNALEKKEVTSGISDVFGKEDQS